MTREEFFEGYCARSGVPVAEAVVWGWHAEPCACEAPQCRGWQMVTPPRAVRDPIVAWGPGEAIWGDDGCTPGETP